MVQRIDEEEFLDVEESGYLDDYDGDDFEAEYDAIFAEDGEVESDVGEYERDPVTGRRAKRPKLSALNKSKLSKHEMDELFLK